MKKRHRSKMKDRIMLWLIFFPFVLFGLILLTLAGRQVVCHLMSQSWSSVSAEVIARGEQVARHAATNTTHIHGASRYTARYAYFWQGQRYESERVAFANAMTRTVGTQDAWKEKLDQALAEPGATITIWVNPRDPTQAVVVRDVNWFELAVCLAVGAMLLLCGSLMIAGGLPAQMQAKPGFSWKVVSGFGVVGLALAILTPLLWRDGHPIWAVLCLTPLMLALIGVINGIRGA